ncbi:MAG: nucleotidyltransferase domain-containing protein [Anaerolineae bacterium]|nr:nucleotidyltransferase domain-containing protein [Anaerolineae bacterium]
MVRLWLFGSVLRDDFTADSDIDVLVEFDPQHVPGWNIVSIQSELGDLLGRKVAFSMPEALSEHMRAHIMSTARIIYERAE